MDRAFGVFESQDVEGCFVLVEAKGAHASGWCYGPGSPVEGWNHAMPYLRRSFADAFGADVSCHVIEGTTQKAA
ncbi:hypothetical protein GCM10017788_49400 [Amycolatopsis acidiphila]|nr:hypothetical protein GCM10017788_49400 [Amycolatopsis acidiphila]